MTLTKVDIINRALQKLGQARVASTIDWSAAAQEAKFMYDEMRRVELRRRVWVFSIRNVAIRALNGATQNVTFGTWSSVATYAQNDIVTGSDGQTWISILGSNTGNDPTLTDGLWTLYNGPMQASQFVTTYSASQVYAVNQYAIGSNGTTYISLVNNNLGNDPTVAPGAWLVGTTYASGKFVTGSDGKVYQSLAGGNVGHNPVGDGGVHWTLLAVQASTGAIGWAVAATVVGAVSYFAGELVYALGSLVVYLSTVSNNLTNPTTDTTGSWITMTTAPSLSVVNFIYPIGSGPDTENTSRNVYILPNGYLRRAAQAPKSSQNAFLGGPAGLRYDDWNVENGCFTTFDFGPIVFRFAADEANVAIFDPMFREGLACRMALELARPLTKSKSILQDMGTEYKKFMNEAGLVNAIEKGAEDPAIDEYISVRV
jgi:hypothetical protein